ncbi:retrovirus-related Pol polyprotein from transposon 297 [Trichonephila clavipes]|nr:retrovirus-related Pol polyprotein from transposon 297 [Trichonephila clavipes]
MKPTRNSKEVSKFLGMSQWYAKFIKNYADLCEPLYNLKRKLKEKFWSIEAQKAFDAVKAAVTKAPVLKFPDFKKHFELFTDASSIGVGAVLNQEKRLVVFASRTLKLWFPRTAVPFFNVRNITVDDVTKTSPV